MARIGAAAAMPGGRQDALRLAAGGGGPRRLGHIVGQAGDFQGAGALFHAAQEAALFQGGDQPVNAGFGLEVQRVLHLVEGGRHAGFADPLMDEHQQFILFAGQHRPCPPGGARGTARKSTRLRPQISARTKPKHGESFYFSSFARSTGDFILDLADPKP